jgi:hypothetical protein
MVARNARFPQNIAEFPHSLLPLAVSGEYDEFVQTVQGIDQ